MEGCGDAISAVIVIRTDDVSDGSLWDLLLGSPVDGADGVETATKIPSAPVARGLLVDAGGEASLVRNEDVHGSSATRRGADVLTARPSLSGPSESRCARAQGRIIAMTLQELLTELS